MEFLFIRNHVRRLLNTYTTEFQYEYICRMEEPPDGTPLPLNKIPPHWLKAIDGVISNFHPFGAYSISHENHYSIAGTAEGTPCLVEYDSRLDFVPKVQRFTADGHLDYLRAEFQEEMFAHGADQMFLLSTTPNGTLRCASEFEQNILEATLERMRMSPVEDGYYPLTVADEDCLLQFSTLYDGNRLVIGVDIEKYRKFILENEISKIFNRFYRCDHSRTTPGNGLGLSMVKAVAESIGGKVCVQSVLHHGTTFTVSMPIDVFASPPAVTVEKKAQGNAVI